MDILGVKAHISALDEAQDDMEVLREYLHKLAGDARQIQPELESE